jgi:Helix-turn-helix domain/PEGA domain
MSVGSYLRGARESRQFTLRQISEITKINLQLLVDLEKDDLSRWPKHRVYRHGYLRSYAIAVGLDPKKVLARFDDEFGDPHPVAFHRKKNPVAPSLPVRFLRSTLQLAGVLVFLGAALSVFDQLGQNALETRSIARQTPISSAVQPLPGPAVVSPAVSIDAPVLEELPLEEVEGELRVVSNPSDAHVTVNGIGRGKTPLRIRFLPLGSYRIRVIHPEYRSRETSVTLRREQPNRTVRVALRDGQALNATLR